MLPQDMRYTLCFLTRGENILMLHRRNPPNRGFWNGIGGRIEPGETPIQGALREIREESGYQLEALRFCGWLTWEGFEIPKGGLYLFSAEAPAGEAVSNDEGELAWQPREWVFHSDEVVSNIHVFGPLALNDPQPKEYHFIYREGKMMGFTLIYHSDPWNSPESHFRG